MAGEAGEAGGNCSCHVDAELPVSDPGWSLSSN